MSKPARMLAGIVHRASEALDSAQLSREMARSGLAAAKEIRSYTTPSELRALLRLARTCPDGTSVLEIGSYLGKATCYLAAGLAGRGGFVYAVDTWNNETMPEGSCDTYAEFCKNVAPVKDRIRCVRKSSHDLTANDLRLPISMAFVDGDHSYEAVGRDWQFVETVIAPDGVVAFHDSRFYQGVSRVIGEILAAGDWRLDGVEHNLTWIRRGNWSPARLGNPGSAPS